MADLKTPRLCCSWQRHRNCSDVLSDQAFSSFEAPPGVHAYPYDASAALRWPRPGPTALGPGSIGVEIEQEACGPTRHPYHLHRGAQRVPQCAPRSRRAAALIEAVTTLQEHMGPKGHHREPGKPPRQRPLALALVVLALIARIVLHSALCMFHLPPRAPPYMLATTWVALTSISVHHAWWDSRFPVRARYHLSTQGPPTRRETVNGTARVKSFFSCKS